MCKLVKKNRSERYPKFAFFKSYDFLYYDVFTEIQLFSSFIRVCLNLNMPILSSSSLISAAWAWLLRLRPRLKSFNIACLT